MKIFLLISSLIILSNCSFNENTKKKTFDEKVKKILAKSNDLMSLTFDEYYIYINEYTKNGKYPDIKK